MYRPLPLLDSAWSFRSYDSTTTSEYVRAPRKLRCTELSLFEEQQLMDTWHGFNKGTILNGLISIKNIRKRC